MLVERTGSPAGPINGISRAQSRLTGGNRPAWYLTDPAAFVVRFRFRVLIDRPSTQLHQRLQRAPIRPGKSIPRRTRNMSKAVSHFALSAALDCCLNQSQYLSPDRLDERWSCIYDFEYVGVHRRDLTGAGGKSWTDDRGP